MTKTLAQLEKQMLRLQKQADALIAKEKVGVIARVKEAILHYELKPADLFPSGRPGKRVKPVRSAAAGKKPTRPAKYRDASGNSWSGIGKRPNWFKQALAEGKTEKDLLV